jgi:hypothetical protein
MCHLWTLVEPAAKACVEPLLIVAALGLNGQNARKTAIAHSKVPDIRGQKKTIRMFEYLETVAKISHVF